MSGRPINFPDPLQRAARNELQKLQAYRLRIEEQMAHLDEERARLKGELARLQERSNLLNQILDPSSGPIDTPRGIVLRGARMREEATRLLVQAYGVRREIHYRDWYKLVTDAGFVVLAKKPLATFLTSISRSPVVERGEEAGTYRINPDRVADLKRDLSEARAELSDLAAVLNRESNPSEALRAHKTRLTAAAKALERQLHEAQSALASVAAGHPAAVA